jgi:hypothetical protein
MSRKKKKSKSLLPKRIAGVKVPKAVRKGRFGELLASKTGQALIAEALMAAGGVAAAKKASDSPEARSFVHDAAETVRRAGDTDKVDAGSARDVLAYALGEAARSFADALRQGPNGHDANGHDTPAEETPDWLTAQAEVDDAKKKHSASVAAPL